MLLDAIEAGQIEADLDGLRGVPDALALVADPPAADPAVTGCLDALLDATLSLAGWSPSPATACSCHYNARMRRAR